MWEKPTILVVDDEPLNVELLKAILPSSEYEILTAPDGVQGLKLLETHKVDLLLLDVMMPSIDGFEVTRRIRAAEKTKRLPVILITALNETGERIMGIEAGCDEFVSKPIDKHEVLARIKTLLKLNYYRSQIDEKEKFEHVINRMNDGLIICDGDLNIERTNQKGRELLGSEDLSKGWLDRLSATYRSGYKGDLEHDLPIFDLSFDLERPGTSPDGLLIVSFSTSVIKNTEGKTVSIVIMLHDVTAQRKEYFEKENFLSLMSWKLRTPLAVSLEHLDLLQKSALPIENKPFRKSVDITIEKVSEFLRMTEKIIDYIAANTSARFEENQAGVNVITMARVEAQVRAAAKLHPDRKVECTFKLDPALAVPMDDDQFGTVVKNLIENAVRYSKQPVTRIHVGSERHGRAVKFTFADNGPGIPSEERSAVFEPFHQADRHANGTVHGLGLGLAIIRKIIEGNLGEVAIDRSDAKGTCISLTLPASTAALPELMGAKRG